MQLNFCSKRYNRRIQWILQAQKVPVIRTIFKYWIITLLMFCNFFIQKIMKPKKQQYLLRVLLTWPFQPHILNLPLLVKHSIILFPGQTLPMKSESIEVIRMLQNCIQKDHIFGVICVNNGKMVHVGTTAEVYEYYDGDLMAGSFRLKAKGRQRFKILRVIMKGYDMFSANVKILPEVTLNHPFLDYRLASLDHLRVQPTNEQELKQQDFVEKVDSVITPWPSWVYKQYDPVRLSSKIRHHLQFLEKRGGNIPKDPIELSFWVAQNVLVDDDERIDLLNYDCAIARLQREIKFLIEDRSFVCIHCDNFIAHQSNMFPMSTEGLQSTYCNGYGVIFETITVYHAEGLKLNMDTSSTDYSWFPGYAWTTASCNNCYSHMGWKFTAVKNNLKPKAFWGLSRRALKNKTNKKADDTTETDANPIGN
ncbi:protein cereblon isoform X2 [Vespula pensylvanica]|uniref:protein cereblon isoform X2 n=3 Tax=Vespula pensylvanica TaxID=30213 RepID=UPI001CBA4D1F|nr:protein cereblon isoform X2 [Vespula pensylvanica]